MSEPTPPVAIGEIIDDKYRVERVLGAGGMGVVVAAHHLQLGQLVALKFLRREAFDQPDAVKRFLREGQALARISSPHVCRVMDVGTLEQGGPYLVMEFLKGSDLGAVLRERGPLSVKEAADYVLQACEAVAEAHANGIIHRDLKPSNLFLTRATDGSPFIKVLDFGISKATSGVPTAMSRDTATGGLVGSPFYMAPEQIRSARGVDGRADLWSLGIILHELLTCSLPFEADSLAGTLAAIAADDPLPLRAVAPDAPEPLEGVILTCLAKAPKERFASVAELATALAPFAPEDGLVRARRISRLLGAALSSPPEAAATPRPASDSATSGTVPSWEGETEAQPRRAGMLGWRPAAASAIVVASTVAFFAFRGQPEVRSPVPAASTRSAVASGSTGVEASPPSNPAAALQSAPIAPVLSASGDSNAPARPPAKGGPPKPHTGAPPAGTTRPKTKPKDPNDDGTTDRK